MGIRDIDLNKDGVTLGDHLDKMKDAVDNLFDGDSSNSNNIFDRVNHQMMDSVTNSKIDELMNESKKEEKKDDE